MAETIQVRLAEQNDAEALVPLVHAYYALSPVPHVFDDAEMAAHLRRLAGQPEFGRLLVATQGEVLVGFAVLYFGFDTRALAKTLTLNDLFVVASLRGQGTGHALIAATFALARQLGCSRVDWQTRTSNTDAQRLYDTLGQRVEGWVSYSHDLK